MEHGLEEDLHSAGHPGEAKGQAKKEEEGERGGGEERHPWSRGGGGGGGGQLLVSFTSATQPPVSSPQLENWEERSGEIEKYGRK